MRLSMQLLLMMLVFVIVSLPVAALAGNPLARPVDRKACEHLDRGNNLYDAGSFKEAIEEYKAGETIEPASVFDFNLGQAQRQLGMYREALWHYDRFLHKGQPVGQLRDAVIAFMSEMRVHLENKAQSMQPIGREPSAEPPPAVPRQGAPTTSTADVTRPADRDSSPDWLGWSITGAGVVAVGASGFLFYRASQLNHQGDSKPNMAERQHLYDQASARNLAGAVAGGVGAAMASVGIIRVLLHYHPTTPQWSAIHITINSRGVFAVGSF